MAFEQSLDLDFLDQQDFLLESEKGDRVDVDALFDTKLTNPVFGNDVNLASAFNFDSNDDLLACAPTPTDVYPLDLDLVGLSTVSQLQAVNQSPSHESDSGMSDMTASPSPQRDFQDDSVVVKPATAGLQTMRHVNHVDILNVNVEDLDLDFDQYSPSSSCTASPPHATADPQENGAAGVTLVGDLYTQKDMQHKQALEFYHSDVLVTICDKPNTAKLANVPEEVPEDKSRKNAIQAKINREKKKAYIKSLEDEITSLKVDNTKLKSENQKMKSSMSALEEEVEYLKSVLVNSSSLSSLLKNISDVKEVKLSATILGRKRALADDHSYNFVESVPEKRARRISANLKKAGVCLHVNGGSACLEFCAHCSKLAQKSSS